MSKIGEPSADGEMPKTLQSPMLTDEEFESLMAEAKKVDVLFQKPLVLRKPPGRSRVSKFGEDRLPMLLAWQRREGGRTSNVFSSK